MTARACCSTPPARSGARSARLLLGLALSGALQACYSSEPAREAPAVAPPPEPAPSEAAPAKSEEAPAVQAPESVGPAPSPSTAAEPPPPASAAPKAKRATSASESRRDRAGAGAARSEDDSAPAEGKVGLTEPRTLMKQLDREVALGAPDCPSARDRKKAICDLAAQICKLVDRDPNVASAERYCDEARQRCTDAGERTLLRCGE